MEAMSADAGAGPAADGADLPAAARAGVVVLDGGLSTEVAARGHDISGALWSARLLRDDPGAIVEAHRAFAHAGAQVATSASYQATFEGFAAAGIPAAEAARLMTLSVRLARDGGSRWVAASVGPYGAYLAGGQEYTGEYAGGPDGLSVAQLRAFHRPRLAVLAEAGPDVLAIETIPCLAEWEALCEEVEALGVPAWLSLTTLTDADGVVRTRRGEPAAQAFAAARGLEHVVAVGANCTAPDGVQAAVACAARESGLPVVVYPNSGETWDGARRTWRGEPGLRPRDVRGWIEAGARLVGGCCRVRPQDIASIAEIAASPADGQVDDGRSRTGDLPADR